MNTSLLLLLFFFTLFWPFRGLDFGVNLTMIMMETAGRQLQSLADGSRQIQGRAMAQG